MNSLFKHAQQLHLAGQLAPAWQAYQQLAASSQPATEYWLWLGLLVWQLQQPQAAWDCWQHARPYPDWESFWQELSPQLQDQALNMLQLAPQPLRSWLLQSWAEGFHLLALHSVKGLKLQQATDTWLELLQAQPDFARAHLHLGHLALQAGQIELAIHRYTQSLHYHPLQPELHYHLGRLKLSLLQPQQAEWHFQAAISQSLEIEEPHPLWLVQQAMAYAPVLLDQSSEALCQHLLAQARKLYQQIPLQECTADLLRGGIEPCFDLNYLSEEDLPVRSAFADIFILPQALPRSRFQPRNIKHGLRLGIVITPGHEGLFYFGSQGLVRALIQAGLEVELLITAASQPWFQARLPDVPSRLLPPEPQLAQAFVSALEFDLIYYWESGTDPLNYFLPFFQLAPVQFTSWASVSSTGQPCMQYFLSSEALETPASQLNYRELLLKMPVLPMLYSPDMLVSSGKSRSQLGLPDAPLLGCPHNPQKLTPEFLAALAEILQALPGVRLVLAQSRFASWQTHFENMLKHYLGAQAAQVYWQPRLPAEDFSALLEHCELLLDPFRFGSGKLAFEALGQGLPLLTWPGQRLRGRIVAACYQQMHYQPLAVASAQAYIDQAIKLMKEPALVQEHRQALLSKQNLLMQHPDVLPGLLEALQQMRH